MEFNPRIAPIREPSSSSRPRDRSMDGMAMRNEENYEDDFLFGDEDSVPGTNMGMGSPLLPRLVSKESSCNKQPVSLLVHPSSQSGLSGAEVGCMIDLIQLFWALVCSLIPLFYGGPSRDSIWMMMGWILVTTS